MQSFLTARHSPLARETLGAALKRVADAIGTNITDRKSYKYAMHSGSFMPSGRILQSALRNARIFPSCAVLPLHETALMQRVFNGTTGVGVSLDDAHDVVSVAKRICSMPVAARGSTRTPGVMLTLRHDHPQLHEFVALKTNRSHPELRNCNISVRVIDRDEALRSGVLYTIAEAAHACGDPGLLIPRQHEIDKVATAPCGELWLNSYEVCTLGFVNLAAITTSNGIDEHGLHTTTQLAVRFLNDVVNKYAFQHAAMREVTMRQRRIGVGIMGYADALDRMGVPYDSDTAVSLARYISRVMRSAADAVNDTPRNITRLAFSPTGGVAALFGASYGVEPHFTEAHDIHWRRHVDVQAAFQQHIDGAVSKTINLPGNATVSDIVDIYAAALENDFVKGITVFRDGCLMN